jgi:hypothetical protein
LATLDRVPIAAGVRTAGRDHESGARWCLLLAESWL